MFVPSAATNNPNVFVLCTFSQKEDVSDAISKPSSCCVFLCCFVAYFHALFVAYSRAFFDEPFRVVSVLIFALFLFRIFA